MLNQVPRSSSKTWERTLKQRTSLVNSELGSTLHSLLQAVLKLSQKVTLKLELDGFQTEVENSKCLMQAILVSIEERRSNFIWLLNAEISLNQEKLKPFWKSFLCSSLILLNLMEKSSIQCKLFGIEINEKFLMMNMRSSMRVLQRLKFLTNIDFITRLMFHWPLKVFCFSLQPQMKNIRWLQNNLLFIFIAEKSWSSRTAKNCYLAISDLSKELSIVKIYLWIFLERTIKTLPWFLNLKMSWLEDWLKLWKMNWKLMKKSITIGILNSVITSKKESTSILKIHNNFFDWQDTKVPFHQICVDLTIMLRRWSQSRRRSTSWSLLTLTWQRIPHSWNLLRDKMLLQFCS